jgi:16S rRNA (guanine966-N2)-methyltransferase
MALRVYGDRPLKTLPGLATRPTPSRVREALFNIWQGRITDCRWLDLCTGSGAMVGVEQSGVACKLIKQNLQNMIKPAQMFSIHRGDVLKVIPKLKSQQFDLVYFDPPYQSDWYELVIAALPPLLSATATVAVEHDRARFLADTIGDLVAIDHRKYGQTAIAFYELAHK